MSESGPSHVGLSTFKSGNCRLLVVLACGLLLGLGMALLLAHPAVREARHPSTHPYRHDDSGPAALQQLAQLTQELRDSVSQLKQQQQELRQNLLEQQQQQQQAAGTSPSSEQITQLSKELRDGVSQLKQGLQEQLQQLAKKRQDASPSPAPAAPAVVPDLSAYSDPVLPDIAEKVLQLDKQQAGKRVISVSLFGKEPRYVQGSIENAMLARRDWPGWIYRWLGGSWQGSPSTAQ